MFDTSLVAIVLTKMQLRRFIKASHPDLKLP